MAGDGTSAQPGRGQPVSQPGHDEALPRDVEAALAATGLPTEALELEITEYAAFNYEDPTGPLLKLQERGVRLAFD